VVRLDCTLKQHLLYHLHHYHHHHHHHPQPSTLNPQPYMLHAPG
jgi:hypothetical protein